MKKVRNIGKQFGIGLLRLIAGNSTLSKFCLGVIGKVSRALPDKKWKQYITSGISQVKWSNVNFNPAETAIGNVPIRFTPHIGEFDIDSLFYRQMPHEPELYSFLNRVIGQFDVILDIGANVGIFSIYAAKANTTAKIYSFEPSGEAFVRLNQNIKANGLNNIKAYNVAVAGETSFVTFYEPEGHLTNGSLNAGFATMWDDQPRARTVIAISGDHFDTILKHAQKVLIKIDVEGAEAFVLEGLNAVIRKYRPHLIVEVLPDYEAALNNVRCLENYDLYSITHQGLQKQARFIANESCRDYYLEPRQPAGY